jgi:hypothetical protein
VSDMYNLEVTRPLMTRHPVVATRVVTAVQAPVHAAEEASDSGRQRCLCVESSTGIEPATPSFPCIPGSPSCEPAFLQVAADRRTSSYVLCRDSRQAHLPADPRPTMTLHRDAELGRRPLPRGSCRTRRRGDMPPPVLIVQVLARLRCIPTSPTDPACSRP